MRRALEALEDEDGLGCQVIPRAGCMRYKADITAGALKVPESRVIAELLLRDVSDKQWRKVLYDENVLQTRSPKTAKRLSVLIRGRLSQVEAPLWKLIKDGSVVEATHACLGAAIFQPRHAGDDARHILKEAPHLFRRLIDVEALLNFWHGRSQGRNSLSI